MSNYDKIWEPVFNLNVNAPEKRLDWLSADFWADQPYMAFGVVTSEVKAVKDGKVINNLYAVGSVTGEGSEHKSIVTAFETVDRIIKEK